LLGMNLKSLDFRPCSIGNSTAFRTMVAFVTQALTANLVVAWDEATASAADQHLCLDNRSQDRSSTSCSPGPVWHQL
jgi:hypothetical protein